MAAITDGQAVGFSNGIARVYADMQLSAYNTAKRVVHEWYSQPRLGTLLTNNGDTIEDGSPADGRKPATAGDVKLIINRAEDLIADLEANNNAKLNTLLKISVNGQARF